MTTDPELTAAHRAVGELCRRRARGLFYATLLMPKGKREAARAVRVFATMAADALACDDGALRSGAGLRGHPVIVSPVGLSAGEVTGAACCSVDGIDRRLEMFRSRLAEVYEGKVELPTVAGRSGEQHALCAFADAVRRYAIPQEYFLDLVDGVKQEMATARYPTWAKLEGMCRRTAGSVALALAAVAGVQNSEAAGRLVDLAVAVRLTRLLREVRADHERGRVYLPLEDMVRFGYSEKDLAASVVNDRLRELVRFEVDRARGLYRSGAAGIPWLADDGSRMAAAMIAASESQTLSAIEGTGYDVIGAPLRVRRTRRLSALARAWAVAGTSPGAEAPEF